QECPFALSASLVSPWPRYFFRLNRNWWPHTKLNRQPRHRRQSRPCDLRLLPSARTVSRATNLPTVVFFPEDASSPPPPQSVRSSALRLALMTISCPVHRAGSTMRLSTSTPSRPITPKSRLQSNSSNLFCRFSKTAFG